MADSAINYANLTSICEFTRALHRAHQIGDDEVPASISPLCEPDHYDQLIRHVREIGSTMRAFLRELPHPGAEPQSMQRGLATAVFEFLARSARTRIVAPDFWHSPSKWSGATMSRLFEQPLRFEIPVNPARPCCSADDQFLA
jgi:hypothetical protein